MDMEIATQMEYVNVILCCSTPLRIAMNALVTISTSLIVHVSVVSICFLIKLNFKIDCTREATCKGYGDCNSNGTCVCDSELFNSSLNCNECINDHFNFPECTCMPCLFNCQYLMVCFNYEIRLHKRSNL